MPIKSKAQRRKFAELLVTGKISPETFEEWNRGAGNAELPERLHPKVATKRKRKIKSSPGAHRSGGLLEPRIRRGGQLGSKVSDRAVCDANRGPYAER